MKQSETIAKIATALATVHGLVEPIVKDRVNPHFRSTYATLDAMMASVRPLLAGHGLSIVQGGAGPVSNSDGNIVGVSVETMLAHSSGEFITSVIVLPLDKASAQAVGSAITYGRRYGVAALLALTTEEDDDGQAATPPVSRPVAQPHATTAPARADLPSCPKCGGDVWDNRAENDKRASDGAKLRPDFACKNAPKARGGLGCLGVIWRPDPTPARATADAGAWEPDEDGPGF